MSDLLRRLRAAVAPRYEVEREIAAGGMGVVFLANEPGLRRRVAIKVLRPELATAVAAERFLREAQLLASLNHPNVVPIHHYGEEDGIPYFVMEYIDGPSLSSRLATGEPLSTDETLRVMDDVLAGLAAAHERGIVHRDVKPSNVFLLPDRALLGDLGVAKQLDSGTTEALTAVGQQPGTPAYMAPELGEGAATPASDVYGAGMVLYEAITGRRWDRTAGTEGNVWRGVPRRVARVLGRALAERPEDRWQDAGAFARALRRATGRNERLVAAGAVAVGAVAIAALVMNGDDGAPPPATPEELVLAPFSVDYPVGADTLGRQIADLVRLNLDGSLDLVPTGATTRWWDAAHTRLDAMTPRDWRAANAAHIALGQVTLRRDSLVVRIRVHDSLGTSRGVRTVTARLPERLDARAATYADFAHKIGFEVLRLVDPQRTGSYRGTALLGGVGAEALAAFRQGEALFDQEAWLAAEAQYERALALDSTLAIAWWRLYNVRRWRRVAPGFDLAAIYARYGNELSSLDSLLMLADIEPPGPGRLAAYTRAVTSYPRSAMAELLLGAELFHRGPLFGIELDSAVRTLRRATEKDPTLAPAQSALAWALIRTGDSAAAERALAHYMQVASRSTDVEFSLPDFLRLAWVERFAPERVPALRASLFANPADPAGLQPLADRALRWAPAFGLPRVELDLGRLLGALPAADPATRRNVLIAQALALMELGRPEEGLAQFDAAAGVTDDPEFRLQAAQWRLLPPLADLPEYPSGGRDAAQGVARDLVGHPVLSARALWTLALVRRVPWSPPSAMPDADATVLEAMAAAFAAHAAGRTDEALRLIASVPPATRGGDPFVRALAHLAGARWLLVSGRYAAADSAARWYLAADIAGWPSGAAQSGEVDWALGTWGRLLRTEIAEATGRPAAACSVSREIVERWREVEAALAAAARAAMRRAAACDG